MTSPFDVVSFRHGPPMKNRFMLAPLTNMQSASDGTVSDAEYRWLTKRAEGGFGMVMTAAAHVDPLGQGFPGQIGSWSDDHLPGLSRLASGIHEGGAVAVVQLHHAGRRANVEVIPGGPVAPCTDESTGARALTTSEVEGIIESFVAAAARCDAAGFDGVELHGAHDYLLCEFLNAEFNTRTDRFGGSRENRYRVVGDIVSGIRQRCRPDFLLGIRLSPERFGLSTADVVDAFQRLVASDEIDFIDLSLWDTFKDAVDPEFAGRLLLELFTEIERGDVRLMVAGHLYGGDDVQRALDLGADVVAIGKAAITNHDFPHLVEADPHATMRTLPVPRSILHQEGLSDIFVTYMSSWEGFVSEQES
jgi:2,4-dienoyl-CoA reductase-like NADH-dependent reductase (Old Yellow Enzyme family)